MNMTPTERAEREAREIVEKLFSALEPNEEAIDLITAALLPKYELMEAGEWILDFKLDPERFPDWLSLGDLRRISSTLQKIGGGR